MAIYTVQGPDGKEYSIEGPEGATQEEVERAVVARLRARERAEKLQEARQAELDMYKSTEEEPDSDSAIYDVFSETGKGLLAGGAGLVEQGLLGGATLLNEDAENALRGGIKSFFDPVQDFLAMDADTGVAGRGARAVSEGLGSFAGLVATAAIPFVGLPAAAALGIGAGAGEASERARDFGATEEERSRAALKGSLVGATELLPPLRILRGLRRAFGPEKIAQDIGALRRIGTEGGLEALQEAGAGLAQNYIEQGYNPDQELLEGVGQQAAVGGTVGAIAQSLVELALRSRRGETLLLEDKTTPPQLQDQSSGPVIPVTGGGIAGLIEDKRPPEARTERQLEDQRGDIRKQLDSDVILAPDRTASDPAIMLGDRTPLGDPEEILLRQENITRQREQAEAIARARQERDVARQEQGVAAEQDARTAELKAALASNPNSPFAPALRDAIAKREAELAAQTPQPVAAPEAPRQVDFPDPADMPTTQESLPGMGRSYAERQRLAASETRDVSPKPATKEVMDDLSIPASAPVRKRIEGKDINDPAIRQELATFAGNKRTSQTAKSKINQFLGGFADEQTDIFSPRGTLPPSKPRPDGDDTGGGGVGPDAAGQPRGRRARAARAVTPTEQGLGAAGTDPVRPARGTGDKPATLVTPQVVSTPVQPVPETVAPTPVEARDAIPEVVKTEEPTPRPTVREKAAVPKRAAVKKAATKAAPEESDIEFAKKNNMTANPITDKDLGGPLFFATMKNEKGSEGRMKKGSLIEIKKNDEGTYDFTNVDTGQAFAGNIPAAEVKRWSGDNKGYFYKTNDRNDPKAERWRDIDDEDVYTNRITDKDPLRPLEFKKEPKVAAKKAAPKKAAAKKAAPKTDKEKKLVESLPPLRVKKVRVVRPRVSKETQTQIASKVKELTNNNVLSRRTSREDTAFGGKVVDIAETDANKVLELISKKRGENNPAFGAYAYFTKHQDPSAALLHIAADLRDSALAQQNFSKTEAKQQGVEFDYVKEHFKNTGRTRAAQAREWVKDNFDAKTVDAFEAQIAFLRAEEKIRVDNVATYGIPKDSDVAVDFKEVEENNAQERARISAIANNTTVVMPKPSPVKVYTPEEIKKYIEEKSPTPPKVKKAKAKRQVETQVDPDFDAGVDVLLDAEKLNNPNVRSAFKKYFELKADAVVGLDMPLHPAVANLIDKGDLSGALDALAITGATARVRQIAGALRKVVGDTKVQVLNFTSDEAGNPVAGKFDPTTNTITLNAETGINPHTILHEMTHAAASATLANKSHPLTKQLTKLFNDVKGSLDTAYGAQNVDEFVSESFSNPEFQALLASINVKGEPISALERFFNAVANVLRKLMGMQTKPVNSALNATDHLINNLLAPAPEYRDAGAMYMLATRAGVQKMMKSVGAAHKSLGPATKDFAVNFKNASLDFLRSGVGDTAKQLYLGILGTRGLADVTEANGFGDVGMRLHELIEKQRGAIQASDSDVREVVDDVAKWARSNPEAKAALDRLIYHADYGATIYQVDPFGSRSDYEGKTDDSGNDLAEVFDNQQKEVRKLGGEGIRKYKAMRKLYQRQYEELRQVVEGEIDAALEPKPEDDADVVKKKKAAVARLKKDVFARLFDKSTLQVYFPLVREGRFKLTYSLKQSKRDPYVVLMFESEAERDLAAAEARQDPDVQKGSVETSDGEMSRRDFANAPPTSFVGETLQILNANNVESEVQDMIMRLFIDTLPETSFARSLQKRKGTLGYVADSMRALRIKGYDIGRQTQKLKYGSLFRRLEDEIVDATPTVKDRKKVVGKLEQKALPRHRMNKEELLRRSKFARMGAANKETEKYFKTANQVAFVYTIGFNVSSAAVNLSQVPLFAYPYMAAKHGPIKAFKAVMAGSKHTLLSGNSVDDYYDISRTDTGDRVYTVKKDLDLPPERIKQLKDAEILVRVAAGRGAFGRSFLEDAAGLEEGGRIATGNRAARVLDRVSTISAVFFQAAERFNRQAILLSQYELILDEMRNTNSFYSETKGQKVNPQKMGEVAMKELAATEAMYQTEQTNGGMVLETAPRYAQEGIGRVALMYKGYGLNMYYVMLKSAKKMLDGEKDREVRMTAFKQLVGVHLSALAFAGIHGVPIYGLFKMAYDLLLADDEEEDFDTVVRKAVGEGWFKGAISAGLGIDVSDRIKLNGLVLQENKYNTNPSAEEFLGGLIGGPALSTGKRFGRGIKDLYDGEIERGIESLLPPAVANAYKSSFGRYQQEGGIYTRRGDPIYDDMNGGELFGQFFGFAPTGYTFEQERNQITKQIDRAVNTRRTKLLRKYYTAKRKGDWKELRNVRKELYKFNKRHRSAAITPETIERSMKQHARTSKDMHNGITISPLMREHLLELRGEWQD